MANKPEWMITDLIDLVDLPTKHRVWENDAVLIAAEAQKKLLEYLKTQRIHGQTFSEMIEQLETNNGHI